MGEVSGDEDVARLAAEPITNPLGRIVRLQVACGRELRERVARAPERLGRLFRAELSAVPHHRRFHAARRGLRRQSLDIRQSCGRQRPARVDFGANRDAVVNEVEVQ